MKQNGMSPNSAHQPLYTGYLTRGHPVRFFTRLAKDAMELRKQLRQQYIDSGKRDLVEEVEGPPEAPLGAALFEDEVRKDL